MPAAGVEFLDRGVSRLRFGDGHGVSVTYSDGTWVDARGRRTAIEARWEQGAIALRVPEDLLLGSDYPAVLDPFISAELSADAPVPYTPSTSQVGPALSFDGTDFLLAWAGATVLGTRVALDGGSLDLGQLNISNGAGAAPASAFDGTRHFVVWVDNTKGGLAATWVSPDGTIASTVTIPHVVSTPDAPSVAYGGGTYLVVWDEHNPFASTYGAYAEAVFSDGGTSAPLSLDTNAFAISTVPTVTFDGNNFLTAWLNFNGLATDTLHGARVTPAGAQLDFLTFESSQQFHGYPRLASDGTNSLLVWESGFSQGFLGLRIDRTGTVIDASPIPLGGSNVTNHALVFDGSNFVLAFATQAAPLFSIQAERIASSGALLDPTPLLLVGATPTSLANPAIGIGPNRWMVGWEDSRTGSTHIYAEQVSPPSSPNPPDGGLYSVAINTQTLPSVAFDGTHFLVVWQDARNGGNANIYGSRFDGNGQILDDPSIAITSGTDQEVAPRVAFDGTHYVVVYNDQTSAQIRATRVAPDGTVLDASGLRVASGGVYPDVAATPQEAMVVWGTGAGNNGTVYAARIDPTGNVLDPTGIALTSSTKAIAPRIATDGTDFAVVWQDDRNDALTSWDIYGTRVSAGGTVLDPAGIPVGTRTDLEQHPAIAFGAGLYMVPYEAQGSPPTLFVGSFATDGGLQTPFPTMNPSGAIWQDYPAIAFDGTNFDAVWVDSRNGVPFTTYPNDLYASRISTLFGAQFRDSPSLPISVFANTTDSNVSPAIARGAGKQMLIAYQRTGVGQQGPPGWSGGHPRIRVRAAVFNEAPVVSDQSRATPQNTPVSLTLQATDFDRDPLTLSIVNQPVSGALSGAPPNVTYAPNAGFNGVDQFTFKANDGTVDSNLGTVTLTVGTVDAGVPDAGLPDAGARDAGQPDAGFTDGGPGDAGTTADAGGVLDGGPGSDAGSGGDAGSIDAGPSVDAGSADAGRGPASDAGVALDAGSPGADAGAADGGAPGARGGCNCETSGGVVGLYVLAALVGARTGRRRRRRQVT